MLLIPRDRLKASVLVKGEEGMCYAEFGLDVVGFLSSVTAQVPACILVASLARNHTWGRDRGEAIG